MPPDRFLADASPGESPSHEDLQQLVEAESGKGVQGIYRRWQASDSANVVLISDATGVKISRDNGATAPTHVVNDGTAAGGGLAGSYPNPSLSTATLDLLAPPGAIIAYAGTVTPVGWAPCNGTTIPRASYPRLFAAIGTTYNTGGEAGTDFRLPNLLGRVVLGVSGSHALASVGGAETAPGPTHTHTGSHNHGMNSHTHGPGLHTHLQGTHTHDAGSHHHDISGHSHAEGGHSHLGGTHTHDIAGHSHIVNLNHDHALASGVAVASGAITGVHEGPSPVVNVSASNHAHDVDIPALGLTNTTSGTSGANGFASTGGPSDVTGALNGTASTGTAGAAGFSTTGVPDAATGGVTAGAASVGTPSANDTAAATGTTADDSSAPAAVYGGATVPTMMPFVSLAYIIRAA